MKLLLHCCCAPCSVSCISSLRAEKIEPRLFWYNPNIHPYTEYKSRGDCLKEFAKSEKLALTSIDEYGLREFLNEVYSQADGNSISYRQRCKKCYRMRLEKTADFASREGYSAFSTTLLVSPYQDHEEIKRVGEDAAEKYGVDFLYRDFRPLFREGQSKARSAGFYMQKYCGCVFSEEERYLDKSSHKEHKGR
ncbi:hypothetical protein R84B8_02043 [Treponema sp. R8-4-B8]